MAKKKYYAIAKGHQPGIYDNWPEAQSQVKGFSGAVYKGFPTMEGAKEWLTNPVYSKSAGKPGKAKSNNKKSQFRPAKQQSQNDIIIYTDGGSINNPGPGGYGVVIVTGNEKIEYTGGFRLTTNNRMELMGCIVALEKLKIHDKPIHLYSDSSYVVNAVNKGWAKNWRKRGWIKSDKRPALNSDLWERLLTLIEGLQITFNWVKGHAGDPLNERCDELAVASARTSGLPVDREYEENLKK